jgi:hypothetical protein
MAVSGCHKAPCQPHPRTALAVAQAGANTTGKEVRSGGPSAPARPFLRRSSLLSLRLASRLIPSGAMEAHSPGRSRSGYCLGQAREAIAAAPNVCSGSPD